MHSAADAVSANNLGIELLESGHAAAAASAFRSAISFNPLSSAESHYNLGIAFKDMGRHHASVIAYLKALELRPHFAQAHFNLGRSLQMISDETLTKPRTKPLTKPAARGVLRSSAQTRRVLLARAAHHFNRSARPGRAADRAGRAADSYRSLEEVLYQLEGNSKSKVKSVTQRKGSQTQKGSDTNTKAKAHTKRERLTNTKWRTFRCFPRWVSLTFERSLHRLTPPPPLTPHAETDAARRAYALFLREAPHEGLRSRRHVTCARIRALLAEEAKTKSLTLEPHLAHVSPHMPPTCPPHAPRMPPTCPPTCHGSFSLWNHLMICSQC